MYTEGVESTVVLRSSMMLSWWLESLFTLFVVVVFFFFKQKTAYEMLRSLVGSEMCIRDRFFAYVHDRRRDGTPTTWSDISTNDIIDYVLDLKPVSYTHLTLPTIYSV